VGRAYCIIGEVALSGSHLAFPRYPFPWRTVLRLIYAISRSQRRSFYQDARSCVLELLPPLRIIGNELIPSSGSHLVTVNHYARPGFQAWWLALAVSSVIPAEIHWVITSAWTFPDRLRSRLLTPLTRWTFSRIAGVYGFTNMPPMPPQPDELEDRARAVRRVLAYARRAPSPWIGLAPEGRDAPGGVLQWPLPGTGRFMLQLANLGLAILPAGIYEAGGCLCLDFGKAYRLKVPAELNPRERDDMAAEIVMSRIAFHLPDTLRGVYVQPMTVPSITNDIPKS